MNNENRVAWLRYGMYVLMGILGFINTMVAPMLKNILNEYQIPLSLGGTFTGAMSIGGVLAILALGVFSDKMSKVKIVIVSYLIFAAGLLLICFAPSYMYLVAFFAVVGIGSKAVDTLSNAVIKDAHPDQSGVFLNLMHMFLGIGAILGPIVSGILLDSGVRWTTVFGGLGILSVLLCAAFTWIQSLTKQTSITTAAAKTNSASIASLLKDNRIWIYCLVIFFYCGHQSCINTWISLYFQKQFAASESLSGFALAAYWAGIVISRLICSRFYTKDNAKKLLSWGGLLGVTALAIGILLNVPAMLFVALLCCGIFTGGTIPVVIDLSCGIYPERSGAITSLIYVLMNLSTFLFPVMMGAANEAFGMHVGIILAILTLALMCVMIFCIKNNTTSKRAGEQHA